MKILLDTDTCVHLIRHRPVEMLQRLRRYIPGDVGISSITLGELSCRVFKSRQAERNKEALNEFTMPLEVCPFDAAAADAYGEIRATLEAKGVAIGSLDMLIGAHALSLKVTLATHNTKEFCRIAGLRLVDWIGV